MKKQEINQRSHLSKMVKCFEKEDKGSAIVDMLIGFYGIMIVLAIFLAIAPVYLEKTNLDVMANQMVRMAEITGSIDNPKITERYDELVDVTGIAPEGGLDWGDTEYIGVTKKVQLNDRIKVTIVHNYVVDIGALAQFNIPMTSVATGRSEVYTK